MYEELKKYILDECDICSRVFCTPEKKQNIVKNLQNLQKIISSTDFNEFIKILLNNIYPRTISMYGFPNSIKYLLKNSKSIDRINNLCKILNLLNQEYILHSGTLLGYVRNQQLIDYDNDIDFAVKINTPKNIYEIQNQLETLKKQIDEYKICQTYWGQDNKSCNGTNNNIPVKILKIGTTELRSECVKIDLFPYWEYNNKIYAWPAVLDGIPVEKFYPLTQIYFLDNNLYINKNPELMLESNYGVNWMNPDPLWAFDWCDAKNKLLKLLPNE